MDVTDHRLIFPLARRRQLNHANYSAGAIATIEEFMLELLLTINGLKLDISVPIKCISFKRTYKLFDHEVAIGANIVAGFHEVGNMLAHVSFIVKLLEFRWLVALRHPQIINSLRIWLCIGVERLNDTFPLVFDSLLDEFLELAKSNHLIGLLLLILGNFVG